MGIGDWLLATSDARYHYQKHGVPVVFAHPKTNRPQWSEVFRGNPKILKDPYPGQRCVVDRSHGGGKRPYHHGYDGERLKFEWNYNYKAEPGEVFLTPEEKRLGIPGCVIVEPHTKDAALSKNKAWPWERWQELVRSIDLPWVQLGEGKGLDGVSRGVTKTFREAMGWIYSASLVVTTDGALHHAAAALGKPAVVLWGGLAPPQVLGYDFHKNLCHASYWCGFNKPCDHCRDEMNKITVDEVREAILEMRSRSLAA